MKKYFDLSQTIENGMPYYPGDPKPLINPAEESNFPWRVSELQIGTHTGTHIDASSHFFEQGLVIDQYPLERFISIGICIPCDQLRPDESIEVHHLEKYLDLIQKGGVILVRTAWDRYWGQELYYRHPYLSSEAAQSLAIAGAGLVGIDALNVDSTAQGTSHAHEIFLGQDILIVENLRGLDQISPGQKHWFSFLPLSLRGLDGSPVRAVAWKEEG